MKKTFSLLLITLLTITISMFAMETFPEIEQDRMQQAINDYLAQNKYLTMAEAVRGKKDSDQEREETVRGFIAAGLLVIDSKGDLEGIKIKHSEPSFISFVEKQSYQKKQ